jgi:hypothetical protein
MEVGPLMNTNFITNVSHQLNPRLKPVPKRTYRGNNFIPNISNYYKQSKNNSNKIRGLNKIFEKLAVNTENKFRTANMKQKLDNELRQIENDEIKRKARRTQKQINNENIQEINQLQIENQGYQPEIQENVYAKYPNMVKFGKPGAKEIRPETLIQFMMENPTHQLTTYIKNKYGNSKKGSLGILHGIGNKPLYNESTNLFRHEKKRVKKKTVGNKKTKNL